MPIYEPSNVEHNITSGHIQIVMGDGTQLPAYWAHPEVGRLFPAVALIHDWWGILPIIRRMANFFAQSGYYVIVPDLFDGQTTENPNQAIELVKHLGNSGYNQIDTALSVLEDHHNTNRDVAVIGIGMGGSLALEAAIKRHDLEAAVAFFGFPNRLWGHYKETATPILAFYGEYEPHVPVSEINRLRQEMAVNVHHLSHQVVTLEGVGREIFSPSATESQREQGRLALQTTLHFLQKYLRGPLRPQTKPL
jgi:carboxymethylenebutenolidase